MLPNLLLILIKISKQHIVMLFYSTVQYHSVRMQFIQRFTQETPERIIHSETPKIRSPVVFEDCLFIFYNVFTEERLKCLAVSPLPCKQGKTHQYCSETGSPLQAREQLALMKAKKQHRSWAEQFQHKTSHTWGKLNSSLATEHNGRCNVQG